MNAKRTLPLLLALFVLAVFWQVVWPPPGQVLAGNDLTNIFLPWWRFALRSVRQGELPLWNPYLFSGVPFLANPQPALFYPPIWLTLAIPPERVAGLLFLLHFWLAGVGMLAWLRSEGADWAGAFLGAVIFGFSGTFFARVYAGHIGVVMVQAWLPAILWATRQAVTRDRYSWAILGGVPVALSLLAGHTASVFYVLLVQVAYTLHLAWERREESGWSVSLRALAWGGLMLLVGVGLAAVQLLPTWEFLRSSTRQGAGYEFAASYAWPPGYLLTLLVPNFFGEPVRIGYWGEGMYEELIFYVGIIPLIMTLALGVHLRHKRTTLLLALAGLGLFLALGPFTILHRLAFDFLPLFGAMRAPARAGFLFTFGVAALSGLSLTWLRQHPQEAMPHLRRWTQGSLVWLTIGLAVLVVVAGFFLFALQRDSNPEVGRLYHVANNTALFLLLFLLAVGLLRAWESGRMGARWGTVLLISLALVDLGSFGRPLLRTVPLTQSAYWQGVTDLTAGEGRVLPWGLGIFEQNGGMELGLESVFGYDPLELGRYHDLTTALPDPQARAYDLLHARFLVTGQETDFAGEEAPRLLGHQGGAWVYERPTALPRAWLVHEVEVREGESLLARLNDPTFDPRRAVLLEGEPPCDVASGGEPETVRVVRRGNDQLEVMVEASSAGILALSEIAYPGWQAEVDGEPAPVLRADVALRAVCVPAGAHRVVLSFRPLSLRVGAVSTLFSLLLVAWAGWRMLLEKKSGRP